MEATAEGRRVAWFLAVALGLPDAAGCILDLYARLWRFDRVLHACTVFAAAFWLALFVCRRVLRGGRGHDALLVPAIAGVGLAIGALWEFAEWGFGRIAPGAVIKGKHGTIVDNAMDTLGGLGADFASLRFLRPAAAPPAAFGAP